MTTTVSKLSDFELSGLSDSYTSELSDLYLSELSDLYLKRWSNMDRPFFTIYCKIKVLEFESTHFF